MTLVVVLAPVILPGSRAAADSEETRLSSALARRAGLEPSGRIAAVAPHLFMMFAQCTLFFVTNDSTNHSICLIHRNPRPSYDLAQHILCGQRHEGRTYVGTRPSRD